MALYSIGLLVALISALLPLSTPTKREVRWYMATGGYQFKAVNKACKSVQKAMGGWTSLYSMLRGGTSKVPPRRIASHPHIVPC